MGLFQSKKKIKFSGKRYEVKLPSLGATFYWEEYFDKNISEMKTTKEQIYYAYALLKACNESFNYDFDEFLLKVEQDATPLNDISEYMLKKNEEEQTKIMNLLEKLKK